MCQKIWKIWQLTAELLYAGVGEPDTTGAARENTGGGGGEPGHSGEAATAKPSGAEPDINRFSFVRTRQSLAEIINSGKQPEMENRDGVEASLLLGAGGEERRKETEKGEGGLDGTMDSDGGSRREYDQRILEDDYEMKGSEEEGGESEAAGDGDDESGTENSSESETNGKGVDEERKVHAILRTR